MNVTVSLATLSQRPQQETRAAPQYDTLGEAVQDRGEAAVLKLLNSKIISVTRAQITAYLNSATYAREGPR